VSTKRAPRCIAIDSNVRLAAAKSTKFAGATDSARPAELRSPTNIKRSGSSNGSGLRVTPRTTL
jgi:hypothetical protein